MMRYFLLLALVAKKVSERLSLQMPCLPALIRPRKCYAQMDISDLGGIIRVVLSRAFIARSTQSLSMVAILLKV